MVLRAFFLMALLSLSWGLAGCGPRNQIFGETQGLPVSIPANEGLEPVAEELGGNVPVIGVAQFEDRFVETDELGGNPVAMTVVRPIRAADIVVLDPDTLEVIGPSTASTDDSGNFTVLAPRNRDFFVGIRAATTASGGRAAIEVRDDFAANLNNLYQIIVTDLNGQPFNEGDQTLSLTFTNPILIESSNLVAPGEIPRPAVIFNILDAGIEASDRLRGLAGSTPPILTFYWRPDDVRGSFFNPLLNPSGRPGIHIMGGDSDTMVTHGFDDNVIQHEYGHFSAFAFSRDSSLGGGHRVSDRLYPSLAYSEGYANFFAGFVKSFNILIQTMGATSANPMIFFFDIEDGDHTSAVMGEGMNRGLGVELSVAEIFWDLTDGLEGRTDRDNDNSPLLTSQQVFAPFFALRSQDADKYIDMLDYLNRLVANEAGIDAADVNALLDVPPGGTGPEDQMFDLTTAPFPPPITIPVFNMPGTCETRSDPDNLNKLDGHEDSNIFFLFSNPVTQTVTITLDLIGGVDGSNATGTNIDLVLLDLDNFFARDTAMNVLSQFPGPNNVIQEVIMGDLAAGNYVIWITGRPQLSDGTLTNAMAVPVNFELSIQ